MCMNDESLIKVATKEIVCYKAFWEYKDRLTRIHVDTSPVKRGLHKGTMFPKCDNDRGYDDGGFYAFIYKKDANVYINHNKSMVVVECRVPTGSRYITGTQHHQGKDRKTLRAEYMTALIPKKYKNT